MTHFIQLHLLTAYAASNLNRDDTGRPKTLMFGGAERLRISSQSLKRAFRTSETFANNLPDALGKRSLGFTDALIAALKDRGLAEDVATKRAEAVIEHDKLGKVSTKKPGKTEQIVHLGPDELGMIVALADRLSESDTLDDKSMLVLKDKPRAADIAMFGRMLADNAGYNVEASVQVAHAFTTHRVTVEDDFYTAVDDIKSADQDADRGAGFLGVQEYGAGLFYTYICINANQLLGNLNGDTTLSKATLKALIEAAATVSPTGKQNAFASRAKASFILQEIGEETPRSLAAAFQKPVGSGRENDYFAASVDRLNTLCEAYQKAYGENLERHRLDISSSDTKTLNDLIGAAQAVIDRI